MCSEHPDKPNEFYDKRKNKAQCTTCAVKLAWNIKITKNDALEPLITQYNEALEKSKNEDYDLLKK